MAEPSRRPNRSTSLAPASSSMSTEASLLAVATTGTSAEISRAVKMMLALVVSGQVAESNAALSTRAARWVAGSSLLPTITR